MNNLTIRSATAADAAALARLAAARQPPGPRCTAVFVAELDDRLIAAVSARDGAAIADPFTRSADAVEIAPPPRPPARRRPGRAAASPSRPRPARLSW